MAVTVDATVGGPNSNSFMTVAEVTDYFDSRVPSSLRDFWSGLDPIDQSAAVVMATTWLTSVVHWSHFATTPTQALPWPQYGQWSRNGWTMIPFDVIPKELKNCTAEVALYFAQEDRIADFDPIKLGIRRIKNGTTLIEFREKIPTEDQPPVISETLYDLLVPSWIDYIEDVNSGVRDLVRA